MRKIDRRTVLRGIGGITLGLPWLEAMAQSSFSQKNVRLCFMVFPNGVIPEHWTPTGKGSNFKLSKTLTPLESVKDMINVHTGLGHDTHCGHNPGIANFLSGVDVKKGAGEFGVGISADQVAAQDIGKNSFLPSLELSLHQPSSSGLTNNGWNKSLGGYMSWLNEKTPVSREIIPANAYSRLFKGGKSSTSTPEETKSILDYVKEDTATMRRTLGREDLYRIEQYFASVRSLEKRIQKLSQDNFTMPRDAKKPPQGIPKDFQTHAELMLDIITLAFQTNRTKIATMMFGRAVSGQRFDFLKGVNGGHHENSHHNNNSQKKNAVEAIVRYHITLYSKMLQKMHSIKEGDKSLLDNSLVLIGSGLWDGNKHNYKEKPLVVAGKGGGSVKTGQHQVHNIGTPMNNLILGMLKTAGCSLNKFGDSKGVIV